MLHQPPALRRRDVERCELVVMHQAEMVVEMDRKRFRERRHCASPMDRWTMREAAATYGLAWVVATRTRALGAKDCAAQTRRRHAALVEPEHSAHGPDPSVRELRSRCAHHSRTPVIGERAAAPVRTSL